MRMFRLLFLVLFVMACNDKEASMVTVSPATPLSKSTPEIPEYTLPSQSNGFKEIYRRRAGVINREDVIYSFKDNVYYLPPPEDRDQKQYCKDTFESTSGGIYCSFIEALEDGEIEVFGTQLVDLGNGEIGLFINQKLYKNFVGDCRTLIARHKGSYALSYSIEMKNVPVKGGDKITFKETKYPGGVIGQIAINFKKGN